MKKLALLVMLALELAVSGCGSSTPRNTVTTTTKGNWEAQLVGNSGVAGQVASQLNFVTALNFTSFTGQSNQPLDITGFSFFNAGPCFTLGLNTTSESGSATLNTASNGAVTGTMTFNVASRLNSSTVLTLSTIPTGGVSGTSNGTTTTTGTLTNGVVWGSWGLTTSDPNCVPTASQPTVGGTFIMCQNTNTCTIP